MHRAPYRVSYRAPYHAPYHAPHRAYKHGGGFFSVFFAPTACPLQGILDYRIARGRDLRGAWRIFLAFF